jgi:hypothetical protein
MTAVSSSKIEEYKRELIALIEDPILQRIIQTYDFPGPVENMESELDRVIKEVLDETNKKSDHSGV